jgi:hypothetical protein
MDQNLADFSLFTDSSIAVSVATLIVFIIGIIYISLPCVSKDTPIYKLIKYILTFIWNSVFCKIVPGLKPYTPALDDKQSLAKESLDSSIKSVLEDKRFIQDLQKVYKDDVAIKYLIKSKISNVVAESIQVVRENYGTIAKKVSVYFNIKKESETSVYFDYDEGVLFDKDSLGTIKIKNNDSDK